MKKALIAMAALLAASQARALDYEPVPGFTWQAVFGMNLSSIRGNFYDDGKDATIGIKPGLDIGLRGEYQLPECHGTYIGFGLEWTQKGAAHNDVRTNEYGTSAAGKHKINAHYVSVPVHVGYRFNFNDDWGIYGEVGPYFAIGVMGRNSFDVDSDDATLQSEFDYSIKTFKQVDNTAEALGGVQRFDAGLGFRLGVEYADHYSLNAGMDWGLTDMLRDSYRSYVYQEYAYQNKLKNYCFSLTFGYRF